MSDDLTPYWSDLKPSVLPQGATVTEDELYTRVTDCWETFALPGKHWIKVLPQMSTTADQIIRAACAEITDEAVKDLSKRFARRYGVPDYFLGLV